MMALGILLACTGFLVVMVLIFRKVDEFESVDDFNTMREVLRPQEIA